MDQNPQSPTPPQPLIIRKGSNVPLVAALIFLSLVIAASAFYLGTNKNNPTTALMPTSAPTSSQAVQSTTPTTPPITTTPLLKQSVEKLKDSSFVSYSIEYPEGWTPTTDKANGVTSTFTLTKGGNEIKIYQAPQGGAPCTFEDGKYVEISTEKTTLRRTIPEKETGKVTYQICGNNPNNPMDFMTPTNFGTISYMVQDPTPLVLSEMDSILKSLK